MEEKRAEGVMETGSLPAQGKLAVSYVPMQKPNGQKYSPSDGLKNGTLFPGLNLPFKNFVPSRVIEATPLGEIMMLAFAVHDLGLYLNTHQEVKEALLLRNNYVRMLRDAVAAYEKEFGPLTSETVMEGQYSWVQGPWPWETA